jgi:hypothetical protein
MVGFFKVGTAVKKNGFHQWRMLAYLLDRSGVVVMPAGIKEACTMSRANETGRRTQLACVDGSDDASAHPSPGMPKKWAPEGAL